MMNWRGYLVLICIYRFLLDFDYFNLSAPYIQGSSYAWFPVHEAACSLLASWFLLGISFPFVCALLKCQVCLFSNLVIFLLYLLSYVPLTMCVRGRTISNDCLVWLLAYEFFLFGGYWIFLKKRMTLPAVFLNVLDSVKDSVQGLKPSSRERLIAVSAVAVMVAVVYISYRYTGFRLNFSLFNVYDLRLESRKYPISILMKFFFSWSHNLLPLFFGWVLLGKKLFFGIAVALISWLSFGIDGAKYPLFLSGIVLLIVFMYQKCETIDFRMCSLVGLIGAVAAGILAVIVNNYRLVDSFITWRLIFTPMHFHEWYYQFFWGREADFFRTNLRHFGVEGPYTAIGGVARAIGDFYGSSVMHANNGLFSDAISNLGIPWLLIMPVMVVFVLHLFDQCTMNLDNGLVTIMAVQMALGLLGSPLVALLLAGGLIFFMPLALLMS